MNDIHKGDEMNVPARTVARGDVIESVITKGDLGRLSPEERTNYYVQLCQSMGLNPHTQPFAYITLNGKLTLYAKRDAADQLRKIRGISIEIVSRSIEDGLFTVHVRAKDRDNRTDEDFGVVALPDTLKGEARANTILKGITKAKRRVTLSISGLGFLDETEVDEIPKDQRPAIVKKADMIAASGRIPKKDAREMYERFGAELASCASISQLGKWYNDNYGRFQKLPEDWEQILRLQIEEREQALADIVVPVAEHDADGVVVWEDNGERPATPEDFESPTPSRPAMTAAPPVHPGNGGAAVLSESESIARFATDLFNAAEAGMAALSAEWKQVPVRYRAALMADKDKAKVRAAEVDKE